MDWDEEFERIKSGRPVPVAGPSSIAQNRNNDDNIFNVPPRGAIPASPQVQERRPDVFPEEQGTDTPLEKLTRHWMNERHAPDILPAQEDLLMSLLDHLRRQVR